MSELPCSRVACTVVAQHVCRLANSAPRPSAPDSPWTTSSLTKVTMPKRSGRRKLSHSTKKVQRRSGSELVSCKKSKRKVHVHPGKAKMGNDTPALRRAAREAKRNPDPEAMDTGDTKKEPVATAARREARQSMGKQLREQELAKRR